MDSVPRFQTGPGLVLSPYKAPPLSPIKTNLKGKREEKRKKRRKILAGLILVKSRIMSSEQYDHTIASTSTGHYVQVQVPEYLNAITT